MTDPAIIEAAMNALPSFWHNDDKLGAARSVVGAVTPLIEAAALEKAAKMVEGLGSGDDEEWAVIARDIRELITPPKEQP